MDTLSILEKKKNGQELTFDEINFMVLNYVNNAIPDYQMCAFLMAVFFQSMTKKETYYLTKAILESGEQIDLSDIKGFKVDKHSSGGIGDKVSLVYAPLVASFGLKVAKISGRGLGITGGTIDKLESITGFTCDIDIETFKELVNTNNLAIISQTKDLVPADKKIYALRDVTGTVNSIPLLASSIMSKKLALDTNGIVLDVKCGSGAIIKSYSEARDLAELMISIGKKFDREIAAEITNMNVPIGRAIGNLIEIYEVYQTLNGNGPQDLVTLACKTAALNLCQAKIYDDLETAFNECIAKLASKEPLAYFKKFVKAQNGDLSQVESATSIDALLNTKFKLEVKANANGYFEITDAGALGALSLRLGAGRVEITDKIDYHSGIYLNKLSGEQVKKDEVIMTLYTNRYITESVYEHLNASYTISEKEPKKSELILDLIYNN